jgi:hypothetical protein
VSTEPAPGQTERSSSVVTYYEDAGPVAETRTLVVNMSDPHVLDKIEANVLGMLREGSRKGKPN